MNQPEERERRGSTLVLVLIVMAALLTVGGALATLTMTETLIAQNQALDLKLYYITEAGVEAGVAALNCCFDCSEEITGELGGGSYRVNFRQGPVLRGEEYYDFLGAVSFDPATQRLVVATGSLEGLQAAMAVIVESPPLAGKALTVSERLTLGESTINGGLHCGALQIGGENFVRGELRCAAPETVHWESPAPSTVTVVAGPSAAPPGEGNAAAITFSADNPFTDAHRAEAPALPPLDRDKFLSGAALIYPSGERWARLPAECSSADTILVQGDLIIEPGPGESLLLAEKVVVVEGDLEIAVGGEAAGAFINGAFVVGGTATLSGPLNAGPADPGGSSLLILCEGSIDLRGMIADESAAGAGLPGGSALLLYAKGKVEVGNRSLNGELKVKGAIIAKELSLYRCALDYCPEIYGEYCEMMGLGVVIKEWIKPWKL